MSAQNLPDRTPSKATSKTNSLDCKADEESFWTSFLDDKPTSSKKSKSENQRTRASNKPGVRRQGSKDEQAKESKQNKNLTSDSYTHVDASPESKATNRGKKECLESEVLGLLPSGSKNEVAKKRQDKAKKLQYTEKGITKEIKADKDIPQDHKVFDKTNPLVHPESSTGSIMPKEMPTEMKNGDRCGKQTYGAETSRIKSITEHSISHEQASFDSQDNADDKMREVLESEENSCKPHGSSQEQLEDFSGVRFDNVSLVDEESVDPQTISLEEPVATSTPFHSQQKADIVEGLLIRECALTGQNSISRNDKNVTETLLEDRATLSVGTPAPVGDTNIEVDKTDELLTARDESAKEDEVQGRSAEGKAPVLSSVFMKR